MSVTWWISVVAPVALLHQGNQTLISRQRLSGKETSLSCDSTLSILMAYPYGASLSFRSAFRGHSRLKRHMIDRLHYMAAYDDHAETIENPSRSGQHPMKLS